ncbi:MAG: phenylacetate--CoA ligase family protein [Thermodesulfobacteriota bacterium]
MGAGHIKAYLLYPFVEAMQKRDIRGKLDVMKKDWKRPFKERLPAGERSLCRTLAMAGTHVPYYRDLFKKVKFDPESVARDVSYMNELPFLTKEIVREEGERLLNETFDRRSLHVRKTGASTGPSALIYYSRDALDRTAAVNLFVREWTGKKRHMKELHLSSRLMETPPLKDRVKEAVKCLAMNRVNVLTDSFEPDSLQRVCRKIKAARPYYLTGHPSTLYALALHARERGESLAGTIKVFGSSGEVLNRKKRGTIEEVFGCKVFDCYGSAEFGVVAHELARENVKKNGAAETEQKILDFIVWPETLDTDTGDKEIVLTGLTNDAMPLIRYRTGDMGEIERRDDGFYLGNVQGRTHDLVKIGGRRYPTHYIQDLVDRMEGIDEFQLEQREGLPLLLRLVTSDTADRDEVSRRVKLLWDGRVEVEFSDFSGLKRVGWRNKFRYVVAE